MTRLVAPSANLQHFPLTSDGTTQEVMGLCFVTKMNASDEIDSLLFLKRGGLIILSKKLTNNSALSVQ